MRLDKFLWCVRLFKTRADASKACSENKVMMHETAAKPGREVKVDDIFILKKGSLRFTYTIMEIPKSRVGAKLVETYLTDITPPADAEKNKTILLSKKDNFNEGGRPTKVERRKLDKWTDQVYGLADKKKRSKK
ncbi:MAG TPA: hypothetical protein VK177_21300 [Flavobacteriales bacterium]|nr:hypothetical protein [Flavobacteriales bacterium]